MPIRINLLAEAQAAEELRRRDPVKRAIYVAVCLVVMVLVWISSLQVKILADNNRLSNLVARQNTHTNDYYQILNHKKKLEDVEDNLAALNKLAANRFLQATLLNSLMHSPVEGIQITRLRTEQSYEVAAASTEGKTTKPASATSHIKLILDCRDSSPNPGDVQITKFKQTLAGTDYFADQEISSNSIKLRNLSPAQVDGESGKNYVMFTLECVYPEKVR